MDYPSRPKYQPQPAPEPPKKQTLLEWVTDVCRVRETTAPYPKGNEIFTGCDGGIVHPEVDGYTVAFKCPVCDRSNAIMTNKIKTWPGSYRSYTQADMEKIYEDRREVAERMRRGSSRTPDLDMSRVGAGE